MTKAARELRVTREAVSRQIRTLEQFIGSKLFDRDARMITLTPAGKELAANVAPALEAIAATAEALQNSKVSAKLTVAASVAMSSYWLTPRLASFCSLHPRIDIRIIASDSHRDLAEQDADIGIWYGDGRWPSVDSLKLSDSFAFAVCAPDYAAVNGAITSAADLLNHTLLHLEGPQHSTEDWEWFLSAAQLRERRPRRRIIFNSYVDVLQAAISEQGVALGYSPTIDSLLGNGSLVTALDLRFNKGFAIYQVTPRETAPSSPVRHFSNWLQAEIALAPD